MSKIVSVSTLQNIAIILALSFFSYLSTAAPSFESGQGTPAMTEATGTTISIAIDLNESGTAYAVAVPEWEDEPSAAQVKAGNKASGAAAPSSNSISLNSGIYAGTLTLSGLSDGTAYDVYVVAEDSSNDLQSSATMVSNTGLYIHMNGQSDVDCYDVISVSSSNIIASTRNYGCPGGYDEDFSADGAFAASAGETCDSADSYSGSTATNDGFYCFKNTTHNASSQYFYGYIEIACGKITKAVSGSSFNAGVTLPGVLTSTTCEEPDAVVSSIAATDSPVAPDSTATFTVTFSEDVTGVDTSDFEVFDCYDGASCTSYGSGRAPTSVSSSTCSPSCTVTVSTTSSSDGSYVSGTTTVSLWNLNDGTIKDLFNIPLQTAGYAIAGHAVVDDSAAFPAITSATYNFGTGVLVVTGVNFEAKSGATNDVDISTLTFTGEGGGTYTLTSGTDVEIDSSTQFTVTLTGADLLEVNGLLNKDGTSSDDSTTYNLAAADDFIANVTSGDISDATSAIAVSSVSAPAITSATYDASTGSLVVTGTNFSSTNGSNNDVDASTLTLTGDGGNSYTLTSSDVDVSSSTEFTVSLNATDMLNINGLLNKDGTTSDDSTTYNLAAADNWLPSAATSTDIADATGNGITVSNVSSPAISSATYDASTGVLTVTGTAFVKENGSLNDVDVSTLSLTGEGGNSYTLSTSDVEITSATSFTLTLSSTDVQNINGLLNKDGTASDGSTTYNISAADNWMPGAAATADISDLSSNGITVSNVTNPAVTSATYNASTGVLVVTGTNFVNQPGSTNDVDISTLTLTGESGGTYTLTTSDVEITSSTSFTVTLSATDVLNVNGLLNKDGTQADDSTTYNLAAADNWMAGAASSANIADLTGNGVTVSSVAAPTITSATYDADTGILVVTATGLVSQSGSANDVDISSLTFTGEAGGTYTLTSGTDVEITSATSFSVTLSGSDKTAVDALLNNNGTQSDDSTTYNLAAADNWLAGAASSVDIADTTAGITASNVWDIDGTLTAGSGVSEPIALDTTLDTSGEALDIFDFVIGDGGTADSKALTVSEIRINTSGTVDASQLSYVLNGPDASGVTGSYSANVVTFSSLSISVADGDNETYTVAAYYNDNTGLTEGQTLVLSVDGDTDLTLGTTTTQMASTSALTNGSGTTVNVEATALAFTTQPAGSTSGSNLTTQPVVTAQDAAGNTDTDFTETITVTEASLGTLSGGSVAAVSGVATFTSVNYTATADQESFTLTANDQDGVGTDLGTVNANAVTSDVAATELVFSTQPAGSVSGAALTTQPVVTARDADGNTDTGFTGLITLTEASAGSLSNNTATAVSGVATFTTLTYTAATDQESFTLNANATGVTDVDANAVTSDVVATELAFTTQPAGSVSGVNLTTQPVVTARDAAGVTDTGFTETITLTEASAGTLSGGSVAAVSGVATFTSVNYTATADQESFTLTANDQDGVGTDLGTVDANAVTADVTATELVFSTQPAGSVSGAALTTQPVVTARDADGNTDTGFTGLVTLSESSAGSLSNNTATAVSGVATFTTLTYTAAADQESFTLNASATGVTNVDANSVTSDVVATELAFTTQPAGSVSGVNLTTQPVVTARDAAGVTDTGFTETITLTEASAGTLTGGSVAAVSGVATFTAVNYTATVDQESFTLTANDQDGVGTDLGTVDANAVIADVTATELVFSTQPAGSVSGAALTTQPVVTARDADGNTDTGFTGLVTLTEASAGSLSDNTATAVAGVATFTNLTYTATADQESFTLSASATGVSDASANALNADVVATELVFSTQPSGSVSGVNLTTQPVVTARDAGGVTDTGFTETITLTEASAGTLTGGSVAAVGGVATFTAVNYTATADQESFTLTANDQDAVATDLATVDANAVMSDVTASVLVFSTQPAGSVSGAALTTQPVVTARDADGNTDTGFTGLVTLTEASAGSLSDNTTTAVAGVATFTNLTYTATADQESFTLSASATGVSDASANAVNSDVVATKLVFDTQPASLSVFNGQTSSLTTVPVVSTRDANDVLDTGFSSGITLAEVNGAGTAELSSTGDTDGSSATTTITPSSGLAAFTGLQVNYTNALSNSETFNLQASATGMTSADSSQFTSEPYNTDATLTAANSVIEPVALSYSADTVGEAVNLFDFTLSDGGGGDGIALSVTEIRIAVSGTANDTDRAKITWSLNGTGVSNVTGSYNAGTDVLTFSGLSVSVSDGDNEVFTVNGYFNDNAGLTHGSTVILSVDGDTDLSVGSSGTQMAATSAITNGTGTIINDDVGASITSVTLPSNDTYVAGENIDFVLNYDEDVTVNASGGTPRLTLVVGDTNRYASYLSGSGSSALTFRHAVEEGDVDSDGISLAATVDNNSGTIQDSQSNDVSVSIDSIGSLAEVLVDAQAPTISETVAVSPLANDATPNVSFNSDEAGDLAVGGSCGSASEGAVTSGDHSIALTQSDNSSGLADGTYNDCSLTVTDAAGNSSNTLVLTSFTVDITPPSVNTNTGQTLDESATETLVNTMLAASDNTSAASGITYTLVSAPANGTLNNGSDLADSGTFTQAEVNNEELTYTHDGGESTSDSFVFSVSDALGNVNDNSSNNFTYSITISGVNDAPSAVDDVQVTNEDEAVLVDVLANDSDSDNAINAASVTVVVAPSNGGTSVNTATGAITYTPNTDFNGDDSFTYTVEDASSAVSNTATVSITVLAQNDAPVAVADMVNSDINTSITIDVSANDTDIDSGDAPDNTSLAIVSAPSNGEAAINAGQIDYTPAMDFTGTDTFTYTIDDSVGATSNAATVTVIVTDPNSLPVAEDDNATTDEDTAVEVSVLNNDTDADGTIVVSTLSIMTAPTNGESSVNTDTGVITYTPSADFNGNDSFTYIVQDDAGGTSNAGTVTITVNSINDAPVVVNDVVALLEDNSLNINVLGNDTDIDGTIDPTSVVVVAQPTQGSANVNATTGVVTYTPEDNFSGNDSFTYQAQDNVGAVSNIATVTLTVDAVNDTPLANNDMAEVLTQREVVIDLLANDSDLDGFLDASSITIVISPSLGNIVDNNNGTVTYTPTITESGNDTFTYTVEDDQGGVSNSASVDIEITQPTAIAFNNSSAPPASVEEGQVYNFTPEVTVFEGLTPTFSIENRPAWLSFSSVNGALSGTPSEEDMGIAENIIISVSDGYTEASMAPFSITVASSIDTDGDNVSDFQEVLDQTDLNDATNYFDITPPTLLVPDDIILDATALFTSISLAEALGLDVDASQDAIQAQLQLIAADNVEGAGCCNPVITSMDEGQLLLAPGVNRVTWSATDFRGNSSEQTQAIHVRPLVSFGKDRTTVEGSVVSVKVLLNGQAHKYPLVVPYIIDTAESSTDNTLLEGLIVSSDHNLQDGTVTFDEGETEALITFTITADSVIEADEVLVLKLDDRTSEGEDLADGFEANRYDINSGAKNTYRLTIIERNIEPQASLQAEQGNASTVQILPSGGDVRVVATVEDENPNDTITLDWSSTDNRLSDMDSDESTFTFDPSALEAGLYRVVLLVTDSQGATDTATLSLLVVASLPDLQSDVDTDGDGIDDLTEGTADNDEDGIPDFLDNNAQSNVLPEVIDESESFLIECEPGVRCRLGEFALLGQTGGARIENEEIKVLDDISSDEDFIPTGGIFDFEVHELPTLGQQVAIVIPQITAIPEDAVYRKFQNGEWQNFVLDANNQIHSTAGSLGFCPPPGDASWEIGLVAGYFCVQLTIEDGGPNDADGEINGSISDPGVVSQLRPTPFTQVTTRSGGGALSLPFIALLVALMWIALFYQKYKIIRRKYKTASLSIGIFIVLLVASVNPQKVVAEPWEFKPWDFKAKDVLAKSALELSVFQVNGSQSRNSFTREMSGAGVDITLNDYDSSTRAFRLAYLYQLHSKSALVVAYTDLGDVKTAFGAAVENESALRSALEKAHPLTGSGFTLAYQYHHQFVPKLTGFAEGGIFIWDADLNTDVGGVKPNHGGGTDLTFSFGGHYNVTNNAAVSLSYRHYILDDQDVSGLGLGLRYNFR